MLTESAYLAGLAVYALAALAALWCFQRWFLGRRSLATRLLWVLPLAALLLTPAYTAPGADSMAPALIVAAFTTLTASAAEAMHAWRPLGLITGAALGVALLGWLLSRLGTRRGS